MRIGFYAPLKSPLHPVPSGDRQMARLLIRALEQGGHSVTLESGFRSYQPSPDPVRFESLRNEAAIDAETIAARWVAGGAPDLWFCYHPYYKAPDLIGPTLTARFGIAVATAEGSYAGKRADGPWHEMQAAAMEIVRLAAVNFCFTARDREGLARIVPAGRLAALFPFIDPAPFVAVTPRPGQSRRVVTVAMMRPGDKLASYGVLAAALVRIRDRDWTLRIVGDGPCRGEVGALFAAIDPRRIEWVGEAPAEAMPELLDGALFAWPGVGEAYGLAYLEAQAAGLPVVAQSIAGVPEVVRDGETGLLSAADDVETYSAALAQLLDDADRRREMGASARRFVLAERSLGAFSASLNSILREMVRQ